MTTVQALELLVRYGDALEETFPAPTDHGSVIPSSDTSVVTNMYELDDDPLSEFHFTEPESSGRGRSYAVLGAAAVVLIAIIGIRAFSGESNVQTVDIPDEMASMVFPGEIVLQVDPLVVALPAPADPAFDTSELGERIVYEPATSLDPSVLEPIVNEYLALATVGKNGATVQKLSLLAMSDTGVIAVAVVDFDSPADGRRLRGRFVLDGNGGRSGGADPVDDANAMLRPLATYEEYRTQAGSGVFNAGTTSSDPGTAPAKGKANIEVTLDIAVVQLTIAGGSVWTVPIDGIAILPTELNTDTPFEIVTFDDVGNEITRRTTTPDNG